MKLFFKKKREKEKESMKEGLIKIEKERKGKGKGKREREMESITIDSSYIEIAKKGIYVKKWEDIYNNIEKCPDITIFHYKTYENTLYVYKLIKMVYSCHHKSLEHDEKSIEKSCEKCDLWSVKLMNSESHDIFMGWSFIRTMNIQTSQFPTFMTKGYNGVNHSYLLYSLTSLV